MSDATPFITLNDVSIRLSDHLLFQGLYWEIYDDQHWAIIGPNGSGKSTLVKALVGAIPIVQGKIVYHFMQNNGHRAIQDYVAYVAFESQQKVLSDESFYQERWNVGVSEATLSVAEFLSESGIQRVSAYQIVDNTPDQEFAKRRQTVVEQLELEALLRKNVIQLSNGERRKITIARELLKNPKLLILDNPFAGLDEHYRVKLTKNLESLMQSAMRVLIVGTNRDDIPRGITHVLALSDHHTVEQGARQTVSNGRAGTRTDKFKRSISETRSKVRDSAKVLVQMENVNVSYNGTPVLQQVNWTVRENEQWALLGPNGAGKTTLLSLILADNPQAYANDIMLFGKRRGTGESIWEIKQNIGWVAPELQLYYPRGATCLDVVCSGWFDSVGLYRECSSEQREVALGWLGRFDLDARADTAFAQISEGEQRLALLARALVKNPILTVLDEPCQGLDENNRNRVLQVIDWIGSRPNTSMIYVTHRADELPQSITHVLRLNKGRVIE